MTFTRITTNIDAAVQGKIIAQSSLGPGAAAIRFTDNSYIAGLLCGDFDILDWTVQTYPALLAAIGVVDPTVYPSGANDTP
jgi:hypothetical protein